MPTIHPSRRAFTLIELLVVIGIIGVVAMISVPILRSMNRSGGMQGAYQQLLDDISQCRRLAMLNRSTVYMVFAPPDLPEFVRVQGPSLTPAERRVLTNMLAGQFASYNFIALRSVGDQPGKSYPRYLGKWKTLPEGVFIPPAKFLSPVTNTTADGREVVIQHFRYTTKVPFPLASSQPFTWPNFGRPALAGLPFIAFNAQGQMISESGAEKDLQVVIPLTSGGVLIGRDADGNPTADAAEVIADPRDSGANYNWIEVDRLTGRGRYVNPQTHMPNP